MGNYQFNCVDNTYLTPEFSGWLQTFFSRFQMENLREFWRAAF